jgi:integrase/recombinase XerD
LRVSDPDNIFAPYIGSYDNLLAAGRFNKSSHSRYLAAVIHFGHWFAAQVQPVESFDCAANSRFLTEHLPSCGCKRLVPLALFDNRSALNHLLRLLISEGAVAPAVDEITRELRIFDQRMAEVWGLSQGTRDHRRRIIRRLLVAVFGSGPIDIVSMKPSAIRSFVLGYATWGASTIRVAAGAVRCYLRYRQLLGDNVKHLVNAIPQPSPRGQKELP